MTHVHPISCDSGSFWTQKQPGVVPCYSIKILTYDFKYIGQNLKVAQAACSASYAFMVPYSSQSLATVRQQQVAKDGLTLD